MKKIIFFLIIPILFSCATEEGTVTDAAGAALCTTPPDLIIKNSSLYTVNRLYMHDTPQYDNSEAISTDLASGQEINVTVQNEDTKYFTFVRFVTTTSSVEILVTTETPITLRGCKNYKLYLLEEDFLLE